MREVLKENLQLNTQEKNKIPYFGICFGMQLAVIEMARNLLGIKDASSSEFGNCNNSIVGLMTEWKKETVEERSSSDDLGGSMRLGKAVKQF